MKKTNLFNLFITTSTLFSFPLILSSCAKGKQNNDNNVLLMEADEDIFAATINSTVATDIYDRSFNEGDVSSSDRKVGMFYFVWLGQHTNNGIYDVNKFMSSEEGSRELWDINSTVSPKGEFHYFSEPLYGYYCSEDPWVLTRHIELLTMNGIDYISLDLTNISLYTDNVTELLEVLLKYQKQGWKVPLVTSHISGTYKEADHPTRLLNFYNTFYTNSRYDSLWLRDEISGKPVLSFNRDDYYSGLDPVVTTNLKINNTIWPYATSETQYDDVSWMDWEYPQRVYHNSNGNLMSVSVSQHIGGSFGLSANPKVKFLNNFRKKAVYEQNYGSYTTDGENNYDSNRGRGWDYKLNRNIEENVNKGTNLETQWENAINSDENIDEVFVTGWNEWIAYKLPVSDFYGSETEKPVYGDYYDEVTFCDTCNEEFSRDIEMTKGGYGDNFYLQNMRLTRQFKCKDEIKYAGKYATEMLKNAHWENAREYRDFEGDAMSRNFDRADHKEKYINNTNRNDIVSTRVSHDDNNLYIQVETLDDIIIDETATNNMNILLSIQGSDDANWEGYQYILNRNALASGSGYTELEKVKADGVYEFEKVGNCPSYLKENVVSFAIPLDCLGIESDDFTIDFKVADGISDASDIMNYYIDGDSAPIGRLNYRYNASYIK